MAFNVKVSGGKLVDESGETLDLSETGLIVTIADVIGSALEVTGARNSGEGALADLLTKLETLGLITDSTTAS